MEEFDRRIDDARQELIVPEHIRIENYDANETPRFEVWYWGFSLCSQKVPAVLTGGLVLSRIMVIEIPHSMMKAF